MYSIYTDGSCIGNPGPGGWAYLLKKDDEEIANCGGKEHTTNNEMELTAVVEAFKLIPTNATVQIFSDSTYVVQGAKKWIWGWQKHGWKTTTKKDVANRKLWQLLLCSIMQTVADFTWVKGHSNECWQNEVVDRMARKEAERIRDAVSQM